MLHVGDPVSPSAPLPPGGALWPQSKHLTVGDAKRHILPWPGPRVTWPHLVVWPEPRADTGSAAKAPGAPALLALHYIQRKLPRPTSPHTHLGHGAHSARPCGAVGRQAAACRSRRLFCGCTIMAPLGPTSLSTKGASPKHGWPAGTVGTPTGPFTHGVAAGGCREDSWQPRWAAPPHPQASSCRFCPR